MTAWRSAIVGCMEQHTAPTDTTDTAPVAGSEFVDDELLVEEISIDGMCGVY
jgi:mycofactocin precursor